MSGRKQRTHPYCLYFGPRFGSGPGGDVSNPLARRDSGSRASSPSNIGHSHPRYRDFSCQRAGPGDFLRWSLSTRGFSLVETRHSHLIKSRVNFLRRDQITHGRLKGFVPHTVVDRTNVEPGPKSPRRIGRPKCFEIELRVVQSGTLGDRLTVVEHMVLTVSGRRWKHELAARTGSVRFQQFNEFDGDRNLSLLPTLRIKAKLRLRCHAGSL